MDHTDEELVRRAQAGEAGAYDTLVERHDRQAVQIAYGIVGRRDDALDVVQDAFIRVYHGLDRFRHESSFATYLRRTVVRLALNHKRKHRRRERLDDVTLATRPSSATRSPDREVLDAETRTLVARGLDMLSERERAVFVLRHQHDMRLREIGDMLGCAEGTVKNYLFRGTQKMRRLLAELRDTHTPS